MFSPDILTANLDALQRAQSHVPAFASLGDDTRAVSDEATGLRIELRTAAGEWKALDGDDPVEQAQAQFAEVTAGEDVLLIGPGLGYLLDAMEHAAPGSRVVAFEPDPAIATLFLSRRDWRPWFDGGRLRLLTGPDYVGAATSGRVLRDRATIVVNPAQAAHRQQAVERALSVAGQVLAEAQSNAEARRRFAGRYLLQTIENLPVIGSEGDAANLDGAFPGQPAILVAAGPSLDQSIPALARLQNTAVIIAADTTLRPLLAGGVRPHIVCSVDPAELNGRHLRGVEQTDGIWLAGEGSLHHSVFGGFTGRTFTFKVSNHQPWQWLKTIGINRGTLRAWGSVATTAFDLALRMGCDPIVFVGHDFAYTGNRPYCENTVFRDQWRETAAQYGQSLEEYFDAMINTLGVVTATDITGATVKTAHHLLAFRNWIAEQTTLVEDRRFINASHAGLLAGRNISQMPLEAALGPSATERAAPSILKARHAASDRAGAKIRRKLAGLIDDTRAAADVWGAWSDFTAGTVERAAIQAAVAARLESWPRGARR